MLSSPPTTAGIQSDHQHWLREIERWEERLALWENEEGLLTRETARLQEIVNKHGAEIESHSSALKELKEEIAAVERQLAGAHDGRSDRLLTELHAQTERKHAEQRELHERITRRHHTLIAQLAMRQHEPIREE